MYRFALTTLLAGLFLGLSLLGCSKKDPPAADKPVIQPATLVADAGGTIRLVDNDRGTGDDFGTDQDPPETPADGWTAVTDVLPPAPTPEASPQERYDANLLDALNLLADRKYPEALAALEAARAVQDTDLIRQEIEHVKARMEQQAAADKTAQDIQTVLTAGKPQDAGRLATEGLQQYGGSDSAETLAKLKQEAEALTAAQTDNRNLHHTQLCQEGDAALRENNLRAAAIAFEQALQYGADSGLQQRYDQVKATLVRYDDCRQRAVQLRKDPANLEDAIAALQEADKAWDTLEVRQELDDYNLALQKRRSTICVADLEVRGEIGLPAAGRTIAEELLPAFKCRFDLVERGQLARVLDELRLESSDLAANDTRREVARLAKVRYMVLGSVSNLCGVTVNARLVDMHSGLIIQSGRLVARNPDELLGMLPQLANQLMMTDEQKANYQQQVALRIPGPPPPAPAVPTTPLPPPPPIPVVGAPVPPPVIVYSPVPPASGGVVIADLNRLPPPAPPGVLVPQIAVAYEREEPVKQRLFQVAIQLGDNLFRRGKFKDAHFQFELALSLSPHREEVRLRIERCKPCLPPPPPPVVVVAPPPPVVVVNPAVPPPLVVVNNRASPVVVVAARPRIAVLSFIVNSDPGLVPVGFGDLAADQMASYYNASYQVVDRGEVCWYMGRLGLTMRDVVADARARCWLGRALNVRFFVLGGIQQTASFDVTAHLVDAETGVQQSCGKIHVKDHNELKLRMQELAGQTHAGAGDNSQLQQQSRENELVMNQARRLQQAGQIDQAAAVLQQGLRKQPEHAGMQALLQQAQQQARQTALEQQRQREQQVRQAQLAEAQRKSLELARQTEAFRLAAEQRAAKSEADRRAQELQRQKAADRLLTQGQQAFQQAHYPQAIQLTESALALHKSDAGYQLLAQAKSRAELLTRQAAAQEQARNEALARQQKDAELTRSRELVAREQRRKADEADALKKAQEVRDQAGYAKFLDDGKRLLAQQKYDAALPSLQNAQRLHRTDEVDRLVKQTQDRLAMAARPQPGAGQADAERRLAQEKAAREQAEAVAKRNRDAYSQALDAGQKALAARQYEQASARFQEAAKYYRTDAALNGLKQAQDAGARELAVQRQKTDEQQRGAEVARWATEGNRAMAGKQFDTAAQAFAKAKVLAPTNVDVLAGLSRAEHARDEGAAAARMKKEEVDRLAGARKLVESGRANLAARRYDAAVASLTEAVRLNPQDASAAAALRQAQAAQAGTNRSAADQAEAKRRADAYQKNLAEGRAAMSTKRYDTAVQAFREAQALIPGDQASANFLRDAEKAKQDYDAQIARLKQAQIQKTTLPPATAIRPAANMQPPAPDAERMKRQKAYQDAMKTGRQLLAAKKYDDARRAFQIALQQIPGDADATAMIKEVDKQKSGKK